MPPELRGIIEKNKELLEENNRLLKKLYRYQLWGIWLTLLWYAFLVGVPLLVYFYVLDPYIKAFGASYETIFDAFKQLPGYVEFNEALKRYHQ